MTSSISGSIVARPVATLTTMGKKASENAVNTAGRTPIPHHNTKSGNNATLGIALKATKQWINSAINERRRADGKPDDNAGRQGQEEADQRRDHGVKRMVRYGPAIATESSKHFGGRRKDRVRNVRFCTHDLPADHQQSAEQPWHRLSIRGACAPKASCPCLADFSSEFMHDVNEFRRKASFDGARTRQRDFAFENNTCGFFAHDEDSDPPSKPLRASRASLKSH